MSPHSERQPSVEVNGERGMLEVTSDDKSWCFPLVWLRDNCRCSACYDKGINERIVVLRDLDPNIAIKDVKVSGSSVQILWSDHHKSSYTLKWLRGHTFSPDNCRQMELLFKPEVQTWGGEMEKAVPTFSYWKIISDERVLLAWLTSLETLGIAKIIKAPKRKDAVNLIAKRIGYLRSTAYGDTFHLSIKNERRTQTGTHEHINFHQGMSYYEQVPGVQVVHCLSNPTDSLQYNYADGFHAAKLLRESHPDYFDLLSTVYLYFYAKINGKTLHYSRHTLIQLGTNGEVEQIRMSAHRDAFLPLDADKVKDWYLALLKFNEILYRPENHIRHIIKEGEIISYDNFRVLHGRQSHAGLMSHERQIEFGYIDWDEMRSRRRVISRKLKNGKRETESFESVENQSPSPRSRSQMMRKPSQGLKLPPL